MVQPEPHQEARQSPFMLPSCLDAHATPSHDNGDRAPSNPPSTRQHPLTPASAPGSPAVPCSGYTHAHITKDETKKNGSRGQVIEGGGVQVGALRCQGGTKRARSERNIYVGKYKALRFAGGLRRPLRSLGKKSASNYAKRTEVHD